MVPAAECLCSGDDALLIIHLRLIPDPEVSRGNRGRQMIDDIRNPFAPLPLFGIIEAEAVVLRFPDLLLGKPGKVEHMIDVDILVILCGQEVDAAADQDPEFPAAVDEIGADPA